MNKQGQAALEFLMTYGWAILSAIIVIGALGSYFYFEQNYDWDCYKDFATEYCESENSTMVEQSQQSRSYFYCEKPVDERNGRIEETKFYYLENESATCEN